MAEIKLSQGLVALVDDEDFERVNAFKWYASKESRGTRIYAIRKVRLRPGGRQFKIRMHRFIAGLGTGFDDTRVVDHRVGICHLGHHHDGSGLDNRKCGLEVITQEENMARVPNWQRKKTVEEPCL